MWIVKGTFMGWEVLSGVLDSCGARGCQPRGYARNLLSACAETSSGGALKITQDQSSLQAIDHLRQHIVRQMI
jgi:hypothetical protein